MMMSKITGGGGRVMSNRGGNEHSGFDGSVSAARLGFRDLLVEDDKQVSRAGLIVSSSSCIKKKDGGFGNGGSGTNVVEEEDERAGGLQIIVSGDDPLFLQVIEQHFRDCRYEVTTCSRSIDARTILLEQKNKFDIIVSAFDTCKVDHVRLDNMSQKTGLPLMTMSRDVRGNLKIRCVRRGTRDRSLKRLKRMTKEREDSMEGSAEISPSVPKVVWSVRLNRRFNVAVMQLGEDEAVPEKVLELMDAPGLTLEDVSIRLKNRRLRSEEMKNTNKLMSEYRAKRIASVPHIKQAVTAMPFGDSNPFKWCSYPSDENSGMTLKSSQGNSNLSPAFCGRQDSTASGISQKNEQQDSCDYMKQESEHTTEI